ncbi:MAG: PASTA domain-containing protein [Nitrospinaceae bacterium]|nr:PASTA domain-containing protein [Nitrospinaceae bacterium]MBT3435064.1 PASTA domain-containing protein [Nitrospinaceae bacterium]MBT4094629.1 PASTA domain-containing protein [Nitrospinaceae bacterium]MBT4429336.1 PASTA domain-containing protein [Nitrospinaceae bacterium]MBT5368854.1 PASTA domain-containing protein [Nitrospinaceae bacterium]
MSTKRITSTITAVVFAFLFLVSAAAPIASALTYSEAFSWSKVPGATNAVDIGIGAGGHVWYLGDGTGQGGSRVYKWNGSTGWDYKGGEGVRIAVEPNGNAWLVTKSGNIYRYTGSSWTRVQGAGGTSKALDIGIGAGGHVWYLGNADTNGGRRVYKWNGSTGWDYMNGAGVRIAVEPNGNAWVVTSSGNIYRYNGSGWTRMPGSGAVDIGIGANGHVWYLGDADLSGGKRVYKWNGSTGWDYMNGAGLNIAVDTQGIGWLTSGGGNIYRGVAGKQVPNVVGQTQTQAQAALTAIGLTSSVTDQLVLNLPDIYGKVDSQNPAAGVLAKPGGVVALKVYKRGAKVPPVIAVDGYRSDTGGVIASWKAEAKKRGLNPQVYTWPTTDRKIWNKIKHQTPPAEFLTAVGTRILLHIYTPQTVTVPNLVGMKIMDAHNKLKGMGVYSNVRAVWSYGGKTVYGWPKYYQTMSNDSLVGNVRTQSRAPNTTMYKEGKVYLTAIANQTPLVPAFTGYDHTGYSNLLRHKYGFVSTMMNGYGGPVLRVSPAVGTRINRSNMIWIWSGKK